MLFTIGRTNVQGVITLSAPTRPPVTPAFYSSHLAQRVPRSNITLLHVVDLCSAQIKSLLRDQSNYRLLFIGPPGFIGLRSVKNPVSLHMTVIISSAMLQIKQPLFLPLDGMRENIDAFFSLPFVVAGV